MIDKELMHRKEYDYNSNNTISANYYPVTREITPCFLGYNCYGVTKPVLAINQMLHTLVHPQLTIVPARFPRKLISEEYGPTRGVQGRFGYIVGFLVCQTVNPES